jgi:cell division protease FtsH
MGNNIFGNNSNSGNNSSQNKGGFNIMWLYVIIFAIIIGVYFFNDYSPSRTISWTQFQELAEKGQVDSILVYSNKDEARAFVTDSVANAYGLPSNTKSADNSKPYLALSFAPNKSPIVR